MTNEEIKQRTLDIYSTMPQNKAERMKCFKQRDEIIELNYAFFGYVASRTFINNSTVKYEDKLQSALTHFCECFWWYKWQGDETHKGYRQDLSFSVFYLLRIGEMIERELNEVKYSIRRSLCMEVGEQLGKHWGQVKYEDLSDPRLHLPVDKMDSLKAIFGTLYIADLDKHEPFLTSEDIPSIELSSLSSDNYDTIEELLMREMIDREHKLTDSDIFKICDMYGLDNKTVKSKLKTAETMLYNRLHTSMNVRETFSLK